MGSPNFGLSNIGFSNIGFFNLGSTGNSCITYSILPSCPFSFLILSLTT
ncbi:MAG: hypothetical protein ACI4C7_06575 [Clostridia bacterium]|nr:hypothetical protein [Clostridia bacterium]